MNHRIPNLPHVHWLPRATRLQRRFRRREDRSAGVNVQNRVAVHVDGVRKMFSLQEVVVVGNAPLTELFRRLLTIINADLRPCLAHDQRAFAAEHMQFDFSAARMTRRPDAADGQSRDQAAVQFERDARQVLDAVVGMDLMKMTGRSSEDSADIAASQQVILHGPETSEGDFCLAKWASTAVVRNWKTLRDCCRQVSMTVSRVSTKRLPCALWVPKDNLRQITA